MADQKDVDAAVASSRAALPGWSQKAPTERASVLLKFADLLEREAQTIGELEAVCGVKPLNIFLAIELPLAARAFRYFAGWCDKIPGESFPVSNGFYKIVQREPIGVCASITAFNEPIYGMAASLAPCLAAGCTMIIKPSMKSPLSTIYMGKLANEAGLPHGVLNIIPGGPITGGLLATHMDINYITFTGGLQAGKEVSRLAAISNLKRVKLELGGKSPSLIFADANLDVAIPWCVNGINLLSGQVCSASSRVYVHESIKNEVINRMKAEFEAMEGKFGNPLDKTTGYGPLVDKAHFDRVTEMIERGTAEATLVTGGKPVFEKGYWMRPTIFVDPAPDAEVYQEEIFGPVVVISSFSDEEDVIARANQSKYGLAGAVFTQDINRAMRLASAISSGTIGINCCSVFDPSVPCGGLRQSGFGRRNGKVRDYSSSHDCFFSFAVLEHALTIDLQEGLLEYTETKTIFLKYVIPFRHKEKVLLGKY
ncbi:unnamed protein product [Penicillium salamii]|nr:unnamed protein product [Penicillium salamii]